MRRSEKMRGQREKEQNEQRESNKNHSKGRMKQVTRENEERMKERTIKQSSALSLIYGLRRSLTITGSERFGKKLFIILSILLS